MEWYGTVACDYKLSLRAGSWTGKNITRVYILKEPTLKELIFQSLLGTAL